MKCLIFLLVISVIQVVYSRSIRDSFGICMDQCSTNALYGCPSGSVCVYNGCGHTCQPISPLGGGSGGDPSQHICVPKLCFNSCPFGNAVDQYGCRTCQCAQTLVG